MIPGSTSGISFSRILSRQVSHQNATQHTDAQQAEIQQAAEESSPGAEVQKFVQSTDEMSAAMAQFRNRRDYEKKSSTLSSSFERVLEEDALPKAKQILKLISVQHGGALEDFLRQARSLFPDPSDLILVLRELLRRKDLEEIVRKKLESLLKHVEEQTDPKTVKAGINCALKARLFGKTLSLKPGLLRASYRQFIQSESHEVEIYADWIASYGYQRRLAVLDFIEGALLTDIDANDASCSRLEFGQLLRRLTQLKMLRSADLLFVSTLLSYSFTKAFNAEESSWLLLMLSLLQQPHEVDALLADIIGVNALLLSHKEHASFLQIFYQVCKAIPSSLFYEEYWQEELLMALRSMTDIAYKHEMAEQRRTTEKSS
ncbi:type III secretion system gatekeeper InvE [Salmonella enterica subsp. salamae]|nr:type III secretion system gatekeeper InvE [Salmonella enterica subsp. salamae]ECJ2281819.1 type III secretion system gatekeeper InvE [Salmonella enterica subsp. salamae]HCC0888706.1 type III secretion system gatekeeper InvE [Salmonella enterica]